MKTLAWDITLGAFVVMLIVCVLFIALKIVGLL